MEFRFNVNEIFKYPIVEINSSLIPPGLSLADKRALWDAVGKVSDVVNAMGEASATAQGLTKPITTSDRLRNSEHRLYLLLDQNANSGKGVVTGMLKTGKKGLYVFDRDGHHYQVQPSCILDFYVHETKQRMGLGKKLYEHMLEKEQVEPVKMAIDRPSDKFLGFLNKHYGLDSPVKQMNNFVVFDGFFPETKDDLAENNNTPLAKSNQPANGLQSNYSSPYGRYGAPRPPCSMGQIIHNQSSLVQQAQEPAGTSLSIRAPVKNRSIYSNKNQTVSNGTQQSNQRGTSNTWNVNQNAPSHPHFQNYQQQPINNSYANPNSQQLTTNDNIIYNQSEYANSQNQQQAYTNMYNQANNQNQNQIPYNRTQYVQQNIQKPHQQKQSNMYQNQPHRNQYSNAIENSQQQFAEMHAPYQQQYMSNNTHNNQMQQSPQAGDVQMQQKKSVQFAPDQQNIQARTQSQPMYQQNYVETQENQAKSVPVTAYQQYNQPSSQTTPTATQYTEHVNPTNISQQQIQYSQQQSAQDIQQRQTQERTYQYQQPQQAQQMQQNMHQPQYSQQSSYQQQQQPQAATYQVPQTPQDAYSQQPHTVTYQPQQATYQQQQEQLQPQQPTQPLYQTSQRTYQPQYPQSSQQVVNQQQEELLQPRQGSQVAYQTSQPVYQPQYSQQAQQITNQQREILQRQQSQVHQTPQATHEPNSSAQNIRSNTVHPQHSGTTREQQFEPSTNMQRKTPTRTSQSRLNQKHNYQNSQHPMNYQTNQQPVAQELRSATPTQNIISNQQIPPRSAQNIQASNQPRQSQHDIPAPQQQGYPQAQHQIDPSTIIPPMEAPSNQMDKNYQYYDSNTGRMQEASETVKFSPGIGSRMPPNASGDMQVK